VLTEAAHLFKPTVAVRWQTEPRHGGTTRRFVGQNPPPGAQLYYSLAKKADKVGLKVVDIEGKTVRELRASAEPGLHRVTWALPQGGGGARRGRGGAQPPAATGQPPGGETEQPRGPGGPGGFGGRPVAPGTYKVVLTVDGKELTQAVRVEADPSVRRSPTAAGGGGPGRLPRLLGPRRALA